MLLNYDRRRPRSARSDRRGNGKSFMRWLWRKSASSTAKGDAMNSFERQAFEAPAPRPFSVIGRYGTQGKYKVFCYGKNKIMTRDQVLAQIEHARSVGAQVNLNGFR
jgi:hypothetical protein